MRTKATKDKDGFLKGNATFSKVVTWSCYWKWGQHIAVLLYGGAICIIDFFGFVSDLRVGDEESSWILIENRWE